MHEISLIRNVFRTLEEHLGTAEFARVSRITLRVGPLSNVEPVLMQNACAAVTQTEQPAFQSAVLDIEMTQIRILCPSCGQESEVEGYRFCCRQCGAPSNQIISGDELLISGIELRD